MSPSAKFTATLLSTAALALAVGGADARTTDRNQPMDVQADNSDAVMADESDSTLNGNVVITQGTLEIKADRAVIHRSKGDIDRVTLTGAPVVMKQIKQ